MRAIGTQLSVLKDIAGARCAIRPTVCVRVCAAAWSGKYGLSWSRRPWVSPSLSPPYCIQYGGVLNIFVCLKSQTNRVGFAFPHKTYGREYVYLFIENELIDIGGGGVAELFIIQGNSYFHWDCSIPLKSLVGTLLIHIS